MIKIPRRKQKIKYSRKNACKHLIAKGDFSASLQPLCYCEERDLVLGKRAYVCQVCTLYSQTNTKISDIYDESLKLAEKKLKKQELEALELERDEFELDISADEFEEEEELPTKYEKRKVGKEDLEETDEYGGDLECPFCGEIFDDVTTHIQECEFAPDDASVEDFLPSSKKNSKKVKSTSTSNSSKKSDKKKKKCPYCGKEFVRLGRHLSACKKRPPDADDEDLDDEGDEEDDD